MSGKSFDADTLEFRRLTTEWRNGLAEFCRALEAAGDAAFFQPHSFSDIELDRVVLHSGRDLYYVAVQGAKVLGYGLLRGWDEGYAVPSLGIAIHPAERSCGLGLAFMHFLHVAASRRGAEQVRLRVNPGNSKAIELYNRLGYLFESTEGGCYVGFKQLRRT
jgi:[ribosomal protein S18]-alanine N-acetyltransferase